MSTLPEFFDTQADALMRGAFDIFAAQFRMPAPIFIGGHLIQVETVGQTAELMSGLMLRLSQEGVRRLEKRVVDHTPLPNGASLCVVQNRFFGEGDDLLAESLLRHWCRNDGMGLSIELTEYLTIPFGLTAGELLSFRRQAKEQGSVTGLAVRR